MALVVSVVYKKRALPLCWLVVTGTKGHLGDALHQKLFAEVKALLPSERAVVFLGEGEFNGGGLLRAVEAQGWHSVCRLPKNTRVKDADEEGRYSLAWLGVERGHVCELPNVFFTPQDIGPRTLVAAGHRAYDAPLYLVTNLEVWQEAYPYYKHRFRIETFFSDQKSRGFFLCRSHRSDPKRLERLMLATCLAYLWLVCLGAAVGANGKLPLLYRTSWAKEDIRRVCFLTLAAFTLFGMWTIRQATPGQLIVLSGLIVVFNFIVLALHVLYVHRRFLPRELRMSAIREVLILLFAALFVMFLVASVWAKWSVILKAFGIG